MPDTVPPKRRTQAVWPVGQYRPDHPASDGVSTLAAVASAGFCSQNQETAQAAEQTVVVLPSGVHICHFVDVA